MKHPLSHRLRTLRRLIFGAVIATALPQLCSAETGSLDPHLEPLRGWLGKTWKQQPAEGATQPGRDVTYREDATATVFSNSLDHHVQNCRSGIAGNFIWTALWLGLNALLRMQGLLPADPTQRVEAPAPLGVMQVASVVFSIAAGWITTAIAGGNTYWAAIILAVIQLALGIFFQAQAWPLMPLGITFRSCCSSCPQLCLALRSACARQAAEWSATNGRRVELLR